MTYSAPFLGLALLALSTAAACSNSPAQREVSGVQSFCVEPTDGPDGPALEVVVQLDACLSSSCDSVVESECTLTDVDGALQIEAWAVIESEGGICTEDCGFAEVTCQIPAAADETYVVRGDDGDQVEVGTERTCSGSSV